jgi:hypothetical protein
MANSFSYIRNRIAEHSKDDLLKISYNLLNEKRDKPFPIWEIFILMKWTLIYGGTKHPPKPLTPQKFAKICKEISEFGDAHLSSFIENGQIDKVFQVIYNQQFYLQKTVYKEIFSIQLKLFSILTGKYDIENSFKEKTGLTVFEFLLITLIFWLYINIDKLEDPLHYFDGSFNTNFFEVTSLATSEGSVSKFVDLLTLHPFNASNRIENFKHNIKKEEFQTMEMSFFTMSPFQLFEGNIRLIHPSIFKYTVNYFIYDFLKANDENFTTEFGNRLEKYVSLGLRELGIKSKPEAELKKILPPQSKLVDFYLPDENIYIEVKATELQAYTSVNPTDELLYSSLRTSIFKAYFEQIRVVSKQLSPDQENFGIIITYKEFFWSDFSKLYPIGKGKYEEEFDESHIPPENVFIIDIYTWNLIIHIVKNKKSTLLDVLRLAKSNNSKPQTEKQLFSMHLDDLRSDKLDLTYLNEENSKFDIK